MKLKSVARFFLFLFQTCFNAHNMLYIICSIFHLKLPMHWLSVEIKPKICKLVKNLFRPFHRKEHVRIIDKNQSVFIFDCLSCDFCSIWKILFENFKMKCICISQYELDKMWILWWVRKKSDLKLFGMQEHYLKSFKRLFLDWHQICRIVIYGQ